MIKLSKEKYRNKN